MSKWVDGDMEIGKCRGQPMGLKGFKKFKTHSSIITLRIDANALCNRPKRLLNEQLDYNREELAAKVTANVALFNNAQRRVYDTVMDSVKGDPKIFFLHSAGGCGKTFVCNMIASAVRAQGKLCFVLHPQE